MMTDANEKDFETLTSSAAVLVAELLFGIFCLGFALFLLRGVEQGVPRGILGPVLALAIIGSASLTRCVEGYRFKQRIKRLFETAKEHKERKE